MKKDIWLWQLVGFATTSLGGTLLHFLYDWMDDALCIAPFSAVNESTWEHMKLLFLPLFVFSIIQSFFFKEYKGFWCIKLRGTLIGIALIPVIFYTYNGVIGKSPDWINIAIFFISAAATYIYETKQLNSNEITCKSPRIAFLMLCIVGLLFVIFTFYTPHLEIFRDPITKNFGIQ